MLLIKTTAILIVLAGIICFGWYGCFDDTVQTIFTDSGTTGTSSSAIETYFPLSAGTSSLFTVTQANGIKELVTYKVGKKVDLKGVEVTEWIGITNGVQDTGYFRVYSDALYFYENIQAEPEKIIEMPFVIGSSWDRFETGGTDLTFDDLYIDISAGDDYQPDPIEGDSTGFPPVTLKTYPSIGAISMTVESIERLQLNNGLSYSEAVKISNTDYSGTKDNYYWYVANYGLVKFVIGATDTKPNGDLMGEILY